MTDFTPCPERLPHGAEGIGVLREEAVRHDHVRARQIEAGGRRLDRIPTDNPDRSLRTQLRHDPPVVHVAAGLEGVDVGDEKTDGHGRRRVSWETYGNRILATAACLLVLRRHKTRCPHAPMPPFSRAFAASLL